MIQKAILIGILAFVAHSVFFHTQETQKNFDLTLEDCNELKKTGPIMNPNGTLVEIGHGINTPKTMNLEVAKGPIIGISALAKLRWKQFDYYGYSTSDFVVQVILSDAGIATSVQVKYFDLKTFEGFQTEEKIFNFFGSHKDILHPKTHSFGPESSYAASFKTKGTSLTIKDSSSGRKIIFNTKDIEVELAVFSGKWTGEASFDVIPFNEDKTTWMYNEKYFNIASKATITFKGKTISSDQGNITIDIGRGYFNYHNDWTWTTGALNNNGKQLSFSIQDGVSSAKDKKSHGDFFYNGDKVTILHPVHFKVDKRNFNNSMTFETKNPKLRDEKAPGTCRIVFVGVGTNAVCENFYVIKVDITYVYGFYTGWIVDKDGVEHDIDGATGTTEIFYGKW